MVSANISIMVNTLKATDLYAIIICNICYYLSFCLIYCVLKLTSILLYNYIIIRNVYLSLYKKYVPVLVYFGLCSAYNGHIIPAPSQSLLLLLLYN